MFWRKKSPSAAGSQIQHLASQLGVERRLNVRINYPERTHANLPVILLGGKAVHVRDISVGGCCLVDREDLLGPSVGHELTLQLRFANAVDEVSSRIVGGVDGRRHVQFLNLSASRAALLKDKMAFGIRAQNLKPGLTPIANGPVLLAREVWSSPDGDALTIEEDIRRLAQAEIAGQTFFFYRQGLPTDAFGHAVSLQTLNDLILYLSNVRQPSSALASLCVQLEDMVLKGFR